MLHRRLTILAATAVALGVSACSEGGAIEEGVVRPGITAITEDAPAANCTSNASTLRSAVESYTLLEGGDPPSDEQALVDAGYIRETTADWDIVDGDLVAENPACGPVPDDVPEDASDGVPADAPVATLDIVTETESLDADDLYATFDQAAIDSIGGEACARELAAIIAAAETFLAERSAEPVDIDELVATGYLATSPTLWELVEAELVPTGDGGCNDLR